MCYNQYMVLLPLSSGRYIVITKVFTSWFHIKCEKINDKLNEKRKFVINESNGVKALKQRQIDN